MDPMKKDISEFKNIIEKIGTDSNVGIDTKLTHAIIIDYLEQISKRIEAIEAAIKNKS